MYIQTHNQILRSVSQGESTFEAESIGKIHFTILKQWYSKIWQICLLNKIYFAPFLISVYVYWSGADACEFPFGKVLLVCTFYLILILLLRVFVVVAQFPNGNFHNSVWERKIERGRPNERASETQWKSLCRQIRPSRLTPIHWLSDPRLLNDSQATAEASAAVSSSSSCPLISFLLHMHTQTHTQHTQPTILHPSVAVVVLLRQRSQRRSWLYALTKGTNSCCSLGPQVSNGLRSPSLHLYYVCYTLFFRSLSFSLSLAQSDVGSLLAPLTFWIFNFPCTRWGLRGGNGRTNGRANNVDETGLKRKTWWKKKKLETQLWVRAAVAAAAAADCL